MGEHPLKFGIFLAPFHPLHENPTLCLERDFDLVCHLDKLGYDEAWIGEHHSGGFEIIANPELFLAAAAERTKHIRLGTGVVSVPYHNPFTLASRMLQLDHQTRGRVMLGIGPGALAHDAFKIGVDPADQRRMLDEGAGAIIRLLRGERVTLKTDWFDLRDAFLQLRPYSRPGLEMAVASARSPVGALLAGKYGLGILSIGGTSDEALKFHSANWATAEEAAREHGQRVERDKWRMVTLMHVAETRERALENVRFGIAHFAEYFRDVATFPIIPAGTENPAEYLTKEGLAVIGTPADAIRHIERLWAGTGGFGCLMELVHNWADWQATQKSYELVARFVLPRFQGSNAMRQFSYDHARDNRTVHVAAAHQAIQAEIDKRQRLLAERKAKGQAAE